MIDTVSDDFIYFCQHGYYPEPEPLCFDDMYLIIVVRAVKRKEENQ